MDTGMKYSETWVSTKTREIKDMTIKGLEPEIHKIIAQGKADVRAAEEQQKEAIIKLVSTHCIPLPIISIVSIM
jgi:AICAR transformylase/IMP cyclohydrolase PurH